jgi:hypothetical protein
MECVFPSHARKVSCPIKTILDYQGSARDKKHTERGKRCAPANPAPD